jgi:hypothetical protein
VQASPSSSHSPPAGSKAHAELQQSPSAVAVGSGVDVAVGGEVEVGLAV